MTITLRPDQRDVTARTYSDLNQGAQCVVDVMPTGTGKCHGFGTPIMMFNGTVKPVQDVRAGDFLMGPDSCPRVVLATTSGVDDLYRVVPVKGDTYVVNSQHILSLRRTNDHSNPKYPCQMRGGEIVNVPVQDYIACSKTFKHIHKGWRTGIDFDNGVDLGVDPYFLGLWLGDGTATSPSITNMDFEILEYLGDYAQKLGMSLRVDQKPDNRAVTVHLRNDRGVGNPLTKMLRRHGVLSNKHIPHVYKTSSRLNRLQLLAGILDSDGYCTDNGYDLVFKSERLLDDVIFLARSLGLAAYKKKTEKTCTNNGVTGTYYRCNINGQTDEIPCRVARQKAEPRQQIKNVLNTGIKVELIGPGIYYGFEIAGNDHLYLLGDFTVTHNSIVMSGMAQDMQQLGAKQCIIAHRNELVSQMAMHIARRGMYHGIIGPDAMIRQIINEQRAEFGRSYVNPDAGCFVAGIDTINARSESLSSMLAQMSYWYGDEGHHFLRNNKWGRGVDKFTNARGILFTATPERSDGQGLGRHADGYADAMVLGLTVRQSIDIGSITEYQIAIPQSDFVIGDDAITEGGDYSRTKMRDATKKSHLVGDVVAEYSKLAYGKRAICFATDVESANEIAALFNAAGIPAASVSAKTDSAVRADYIRRFKTGQIWVLVNVDLFGEGFDVPACEVVIMARPTASLGLYLQMFGRALRAFAGKAFGLIIDHVSNWKRHGFPDKPRNWTLDRREKRAKREKDPEEIELTPCQGCSRPYERFHPACPYCGWEPPLSAVARRSIEQVDGDLLLLDADVLAQMRAAAVLESPASVQERVERAAGPLAGKAGYNRAVERHEAQQRLSASIAQWAGIQRAKGRPDAQSYRRFYLTTGVDVLTALTGSRAEMEKLAETVEGWYL